MKPIKARDVQTGETILERAPDGYYYLGTVDRVEATREGRNLWFDGASWFMWLPNDYELARRA